MIGSIAMETWRRIYERNRFWVEVANEAARDFERRFGVDGIGIAFMRAALSREVVLKNTDSSQNAIAPPFTEKSRQGSIHFQIPKFAHAVSIVLFLECFIPNHASPAGSKGDGQASPTTSATKPQAKLDQIAGGMLALGRISDVCMIKFPPARVQARQLRSLERRIPRVAAAEQVGNEVEEFLLVERVQHGQLGLQLKPFFAEPIATPRVFIGRDR